MLSIYYVYKIRFNILNYIMFIADVCPKIKTKMDIINKHLDFEVLYRRLYLGSNKIIWKSNNCNLKYEPKDRM